MNGDKAWYASKAIWASVLQVVAGVAIAGGFLSEEQGAIVQNEFPELIAGGAVVLLGAIGAWGRIVASKTLTL